MEGFCSGAGQEIDGTTMVARAIAYPAPADTAAVAAMARAILLTMSFLRDQRELE
jgi:hypothetical protein